MKPRDLIPPFTKDCKQIIIEDRIWYLPHLCDIDIPFHFPGWHSEQIFSSSQPVYLEYCSGNGDWIAEKAQMEKKCNWVAIEKKFDRTRKIWSKIKNKKLDNLFVVCGEGLQATVDYFPSESIEGVFINFPDPWPKKRHARHRIIQPLFIEEMKRILKKGKFFTFVTDDEDFSVFSLKVMETVSGFEPLFASPHYVNEYPNYGSSYFEALWRKKGKNIRYHVFKKL